MEISTGATVTGNVIWDNGARTPWGWGARILIASSGSVEGDGQHARLERA